MPPLSSHPEGNDSTAQELPASSPSNADIDDQMSAVNCNPPPAYQDCEDRTDSDNVFSIQHPISTYVPYMQAHSTDSGVPSIRREGSSLDLDCEPSSVRSVGSERVRFWLPNCQSDSPRNLPYGSGNVPRKDIEAKARRKNKLNHHNLRNLLTGLDPKLSFRGQADVMHAAAQMIRAQYEHILRLEKLLDQIRRE